MNAPASSSHFLEVAAECAREAGAILLSEFGRPQKIDYKGEVDLVTEADRKSEASVLARLRTHFPKHALVAEESGAVDANSPFVWYVDPLDGTTNFAHGYPCFCVSIGLFEAGRPLVGVVFEPVRGELFTAARGEGAWLNGRRIRVSPVGKLAKSLLATGFPSQKRTENPNIHYYWEYTLHSHGVRRDGSAALDLCYVAAGRFDGFWEFGLKSWDTAAGMLMIQEAGGQVSDFAGRPYVPGGPEILASNGGIHTEMQALARDIAERAATRLPG